MTFMNFAEAKEACQFELEQWEAAQAIVENANEALEAARDSNDEAGGFLDDSSFWDASLAVGAIGICIVASGGICALGILGGGLGVAASESDRSDEIESAKQALRQAEIVYDSAVLQATVAGAAYIACLFHHLSKGGGD
jgi:hypothetical protein